MQTDLANNMGTSLALLQRSYFHFDARAAADRLSGETKSERFSTDKSLPRKKIAVIFYWQPFARKNRFKERKNMSKKAKTRTDIEIFRDAFSSAFGEDVEVTEGPEIDEKLLAPHKCSIHHRPQIEASKLCGCFSCLSTFPPGKIEEWTDVADTALCPLCGIDAVIGDASGFPITKEFLSEMCQAWFGYLPEEGKEITKPTIIFR